MQASASAMTVAARLLRGATYSSAILTNSLTKSERCRSDQAGAKQAEDCCLRPDLSFEPGFSTAQHLGIGGGPATLGQSQRKRKDSMERAEAALTPWRDGRQVRGLSTFRSLDRRQRRPEDRLRLFGRAALH